VRPLANFFSALLSFFGLGHKTLPPDHQTVWQLKWSKYLERTVNYYQNLNSEDRVVFEKRILLFLHTTQVEGGVDVEVTDEDKLLVASSAIIPVWAFPKWHYFNLKAVYLLPTLFNANFVCGEPDSLISGMVGTGPMAGKLALSKPHLHQGFMNARDKQNVGIHEFVHLIDMADGQCDGFPERLKEYSYAIPWFEFVRKKIADIHNNTSNIRDYGATNNAEFFSVASEYFFERPKMLQKKHPQLTKELEQFYQQSVVELANDKKYSRNGPCPCGSNKKYKRCCGG
jgi:Mlc titration factor MtfA (ptsG expression regulator)